MATIQQLVGRWRLVESKGFDEYMKELGEASACPSVHPGVLGPAAPSPTARRAAGTAGPAACCAQVSATGPPGPPAPASPSSPPPRVAAPTLLSRSAPTALRLLFFGGARGAAPRRICARRGDSFSLVPPTAPTPGPVPALAGEPGPWGAWSPSSPGHPCPRGGG